MKTLIYIWGLFLLVSYILEISGQYGGLPEHYPKYLKTGQYAQAFQRGGVKTSGVKSYSKTYTKTGGSSSYLGGDTRDSRQVHTYSKTHQQSTGCRGPPTPPMNSNIRCSATQCNITCLSGHQFPEGDNRVTAQCVAGSWLMVRSPPEGFGAPQYRALPSSCAPVCSPPCQNNGICYSPNRCNCPQYFTGPTCEVSSTPCLNPPPSSRNARRMCTSSSCRVICLAGHSMLNPLSQGDGPRIGITTLKCVGGDWVKENGARALDGELDCTPECKLGCNTGKCIGVDVCQCGEEYRGPQCQYRADACNIKSLNFNGGYNCSGDLNTLKCNVRCPAGIEFEYQPATIYICKYETGIFEPSIVPQCDFGNNFEIIPFNSTDKKMYKEEYGSYSTNYKKWQYGTEHSAAKGAIPLSTIEQRLPEPGTCYTWSGNHVKTFDGHIFSATSECSHTLVRDAADNTFSIVISHSYGHRKIFIYLQDKEYTLTVTDTLSPALYGPGGKRLPLPGQVPGLRGEIEGHHVKIELDSLGVVLKWDTEFLLQVTVNEALWNKTEGLCGRIDGDPSNDMIGKDGLKKKTVAAFADSWKINLLGETCTSVVKDTFLCSTVSKTLASRAHAYCTELLSDKRFASCHEVISSEEYLEACQWDYCACGAQPDPGDCACETIEVMVEECKKKTQLGKWRDEETCPMQCTGGRVYNYCAPTLSQPTCGMNLDEEDLVNTVSNKCYEGCFCPKGTVLHDGECISPEQCPCSLRGREFAPGAQVPKRCNTCTCQSGRWICTNIQCGSRCSAIGDPHYETFDGKRFDFMGQCTYYLVKSTNFSIEADNVACAGAISLAMNFPVNIAAGLPSCTRSVTIRTSSGHEIKLKQNQEILVDGHDVLKLPHIVGKHGDVIRMASSLFVVVELNNGMEVWWDGVTRVYVDAPPSARGTTRGLCGTFNSNEKDDFLTPEGDIETDPIAFANKWKVEDMCEDIKPTQHAKDHPCELNLHNKEKAERYCQIVHNKLFSKCHWLVDPQQYYEDCLYDMCSCETKISDCLCSTIAAYGSACAAVGVGINWRSEVEECAILCPNGEVYQPCANPCTRTCQDIATRPNCKSNCVEGCNCPEGQALNDDGECVEIQSCSCHHDGVQFPSGYKEIRQASLSQEICTCQNAKWDCKPATKEEIKLHPKLEDRKTICSISKHQEFTTCEPVEPITCRNMHQKHLFETSPAVCQPGCKCSQGYVLKDALGSSGVCIRPTECPCHHGGKSYKEGEIIKTDCNNCTCTEGIWDCTKKICAGECTSWGDSHFTTFDGKDFDYQGQCDYVLSKGSLGNHDSFEIIVQNVPCGTLGISCTKSVTILISGESITLTKDKPIPNYKLLKRISLRQTDLFVIIEASDLGLTVIWDKSTRISIRLAPRWQNKLKGLCGNFNNNGNDDFQTPSGGFSETSPLIFGDSWRVNPACPKGVEVEDTCAKKPERRSWAVKKCGILKSEVFQPCHSTVSVEKFLERCIFDSCACDQGGDCECLCTALAQYAQECNNKGVHIKWRKQNLCPLQCDERCSQYTPCVSTCPLPTCDNIPTLSHYLQQCKDAPCIEGCAPVPCPEGYIHLNSSYLECVPRNTCKPICMEIDGQIYSEGDVIEQDDCHKCFCSKNKKICTGKPCEKTTILPIITVPNDGLVKCINGWSEWINQDVSKSKNEFKFGKKIDIEPIPSGLILNKLESGGKCLENQIIDIECRTVNGKIDPKATGLDVECSLERGLICKSDRKGKKCPDFEIRILCNCDQTKPVTFAPAETCDVNSPNRKHESNCHLFYQCVPTENDHILVEKTCGPNMWYNPQTQICDWFTSVLEIRPECEELESKIAGKPKILPRPDLDSDMLANKTLCPPGYVYSDCGTECHRLCMFYNYMVRSKGHCMTGSACEAGCVKQERDLACPPGYLWRDNSTCVQIDDCVCRAHDGTPVKPGTIYQESPCEICQCISNHYTCDTSSCTTTPPPSTQPPAAIDLSTPIILPVSETPPEKCPPGRYTKLLDQDADYFINDASFTSSGVLNDGHQPWHARLGAKLPENSAGSWSPFKDNQDQYLQVDLGRVEPVYGVILLGSPIYDSYVTSFQVLYSPDQNGNSFRYAMTKTGMPQLFRGSVDQRTPVKAFFDVPVEARYIRINPKTWHNSIALRLDIIGCSELITTTTEKIQTTIEEIIFDVLPETLEPQEMCDEPMGVQNGLLNDENIEVSSEKHPTKSHGLKLNDTTPWQPLTNSPNEFIKFDFEEPRQLTGLTSKGGPHGWVSAYKVSYSHNDYNWNPIIDDFGNEKQFAGNFDQDTPYTNMFEKPIRAQFMKIVPKKWTNTIEMRVEPLGCFEPYPTSAINVLPEVEEPVIRCQHCPDTAVPVSETVSGVCLCHGSQYWDGAKCVPRAQCSCKVGSLSYPVGTVFEKEDCSECLCALGGVSQCTPKKCPSCEPGLKSEVSSTCGCICKPCPVNEVLCPTSNICINESKWCDGIMDCPDDEINCIKVTTIEPIITTQKINKLQCPPIVCPPGFKINLKKPNRDEDLQKNLSPMFHMYGGRKTKQNTNQMAARYYGAKGRTITSRTGYQGSKNLPRKPLKTSHSTLKNIKQQVCVEFSCDLPEIIDKCPEPGCPPGYTITYKDDGVESMDENICSSYECHPPPVKDDICNITGRSFNTFDGTEFKYDICNHVIARDLHFEDWDVILVKNCTDICSRDLVIRHGSQLVKMFSDLSIEYNGYRYTAEQTSRIGAKNLAFVVSRMGDTLLFVSNHYGFWIMWNKQANVKLGVTEKLLGQVDGLCGFYDKNPKNDKRRPDGRQAKTSVIFGDSWLLEDQKPEICETRSCPLHVQNLAFKMCQAVKERILAPCLHAMEDIDGWISRCLETTCACLEQAKGSNQTIEDADNCRCNVLETFVVECTTARPNIELEDWRMSLECPASCDAPLVHHDCYRRRCEPSCSNLAETDACPTLPNLCFPGCYCPAGLVRKKDKCVAPRECRDCECNVLPHLEYVTYDGANHTASTNCTYIMSREKVEKSENDRDFEVYVTNGPCPLNAGKMCTSVITLLVNKHRIQIRRGASQEDDFIVSIDDINLETLPFDNGWIEVTKLPARHINILIPKLQIELRNYYPTLGSSLRVPSHLYSSDLEGICGDCDRNPENDNMSPESIPILSEPDFVNSWKYSVPGEQNDETVCVEEEMKECQQVKGPDGKDPCQVLLDADRFGQCHILLDPAIFLSTCYHDTCGGKADAACSSLETYAMACRAQGLCIDYHTELCPARTCPPEAEYQLCGAPCIKTCDNPKGCKKGLPKEGCFCPEGLVLKNNTECVEERLCFHCDEFGHYPGDSWSQDACTKCECDLQTHSVRCETKSCPAVDTICEDGFEPLKIKKSESECCEKYACVPINTTKLTCDEPKPLLCSEDQIRKLEKRPDGCLDYVCQCLPASECPDLTSPTSEPLPEGMERILNDSGCCPKEELICKVEKCPKPQTCPKYHTAEKQKVEEGLCCPEYKCVAPADKCIFTKMHTAADIGGERPLTTLEQETILMDINSTVNDGPCRVCECETGLGGPHTSCKVTECPSLAEASASSPEYQLEEIWTRGQCCAHHKRTACKHNNVIHIPGDKFPFNASTPCVLLECLITPTGDISLTRHIVSCDTKCKPGYEYQAADSSDECCGSCKQTHCIVDGKLKKINETWSSEDFCTEFKCIKENDEVYTSKKEVQCVKPTDDMLQEYVYEYTPQPNTCCGVYKPVACLVNSTVHYVGETWPDPNGDPCISVSCLHTGSALSHERSRTSCSSECRPGWRYSPPGAEDICCGACVQHSCVSQSEMHLPGDSWTEDDPCTTYVCVQQPDGTLTTAVTQETCPDVSSCSPENTYQEGCCRKCNMTSEAQKSTCEPVPLPVDDTIGLVVQMRLDHGRCRNIDPLEGFTECRGLCTSGTFFNQKTSNHESVCKCCAAVQYTGLPVELHCPDGYKFKKQVAVPSLCSCELCENERPNTKTKA